MTINQSNLEAGLKAALELPKSQKRYDTGVKAYRTALEKGVTQRNAVLAGFDAAFKGLATKDDKMKTARRASGINVSDQVRATTESIWTRPLTPPKPKSQKPKTVVKTKTLTTTEVENNTRLAKWVGALLGLIVGVIWTGPLLFDTYKSHTHEPIVASLLYAAGLVLTIYVFWHLFGMIAAYFITRRTTRTRQTTEVSNDPKDAGMKYDSAPTTA